MFILKCVLWCWWFWGIGGLFKTKNICEKRLVCCVCNVSCLCPTSYDLQSHEQKKEGERFSYEVCDSKHHILYLADSPTKPKAQCTPSLISCACLDQEDSEITSSVSASSCCHSSFHKPTGAPGEWGRETVPRRQAGSWHSSPLPRPPPLTTTTIQKNIPRVARGENISGQDFIYIVPYVYLIHLLW